MYKVGDKVIIGHHMKLGGYYGEVFFVQGMDIYKGRTATISNVKNYGDGDVIYILDIDKGNWSWSEEMLGLIPKISPDDIYKLLMSDDGGK